MVRRCARWWRRWRLRSRHSANGLDGQLRAVAELIEAGHIPALDELLADPGVDETQPA